MQNNVVTAAEAPADWKNTLPYGRTPVSINKTKQTKRKVDVCYLQRELADLLSLSGLFKDDIALKVCHIHSYLSYYAMNCSLSLIINGHRRHCFQIRAMLIATSTR